MNFKGVLMDVCGRGVGVSPVNCFCAGERLYDRLYTQGINSCKEVEDRDSWTANIRIQLERIQVGVCVSVKLGGVRGCAPQEY